MLECSSRSLNTQLTYVTYLKYICESEFDLRESPDWLSQRKKVGSSSSVELHQRDLRLYGPQVRALEHSHRHDRYCHDRDRCIC